jgi:pimeloyl-ACP methyl ester carboxylesterase
MSIRERWVDSGGVRLHCLESLAPEPTTQVPLLIIPGVFGNAEDYIDEMTRLAPRRCLAVSLRGRGKSDVPASGYRLDDHVSDIAATVAQCDLEKPAMMGYAIGAAYAIAYAVDAPEKISGLIIGDYPARYRVLSAKWIETALETMGARANPEVARALHRDSALVPLWERLGSLRGPIAVMRGAQAGSMVTAEVAAKYQEHRPDVEITTLKNNGHELWKPDFDSYIGAIENFLGCIDKMNSENRATPPARSRRLPS